MITDGREGGFTLIETLAAFLIAATSLGLLFRIHSNATSTSILAVEYATATQLAQSLIAEAPVTATTPAFTKSGIVGGKYRWAARGEPYGRPAEDDYGDPDAARYRLRTIDVQVEWESRDKERRVELHTVKPFFEKREP